MANDESRRDGIRQGVDHPVEDVGVDQRAACGGPGRGGAAPSPARRAPPRIEFAAFGAAVHDGDAGTWAAGGEIAYGLSDRFSVTAQGQGTANAPECATRVRAVVTVSVTARIAGPLLLAAFGVDDQIPVVSDG